MVESVSKVSVGRVGARVGSRITIRDTGPSVDDSVWAKRMAHRSNRRASAIIGRNVLSIPSAPSSINRLSALSF